MDTKSALHASLLLVQEPPMIRVSRPVAAGLFAFALPCLFAFAGLGVSSGVWGVKAQEPAVAPQYAQERGRGRKARERRRGRAERQSPPAVPPGMQQAAPIATIGDWNVFTSSQGRAKVCYAIAQPRARSPKTLSRDSGYLFVTARKGENVQNEIAVMFGFPPKLAASQTKPGASPAPSDPYLSVGNVRYGLVVKGENAWILNQSEEAKIVTEMGKHATATVKSVSMRGTSTSDDYALAGFADAMKRTRDECK